VKQLDGWIKSTPRDQMRQALRSEEFRILSGAVNALCEKTVIWLDDKPAGNDISRLSSL